MRIMHISRATLMVCQFLIPVIEAQKRRGDYVCVCGSDDSDVQKLQDIGIDVFTHRLKRNLNPFNLAREILRIKRTLIKQKIDVVVCHSPIGAGVGRISAMLAKTPYIIYFAHGLPCAPGQSILIWLVWFCIEKVLGKITNAMLVMNNYDEQLCKTHHLIKDTSKVFRISGMGVDLKKFKPQTAEDKCHRIRRELDVPEGKKIVLCVAYLIPEKGVFVLLDAAGKICAERRDVCFLLAGSGPSMDKLGKSIKATHFEDNFKLLGWRGDIDRLMQIADVFVLPTYYFEGLPVAILEAMACGKPVVTTQHRGCEDVVVNGQTGFLVPVKQVEPLAEKIWCLLDDEQLRTQMGQAGRRRVESHFEFDYCTERIVKALEDACRE